MNGHSGGLERALIVQRQWLDRIFDNNKTWEMRSTRTSVTGRIGMIEAGSGLIVGEGILTGCLQPLSRNQALASIAHHQVDDLSLLEKWRYPWLIFGAKRYENPIQYEHPKGAVIWVRLKER